MQDPSSAFALNQIQMMNNGLQIPLQQLQEHHHQEQQQHQEQLRCPRCDSTNTKFCYYNNYNLSQPRHFCKSCRRYWTKGGALRNIPVGGASRKTTKRSSKRPSKPTEPPALEVGSLQSGEETTTSFWSSGNSISTDNNNNGWPDLAIYTTPDSRFQ